MKREADIGEWQIDKNGRRFRMIGNIKEHEPEISVHGVMIPISQADTVRKNCENKQITEAEPVLGFCPLRASRVHIRCEPGCAFYDNGCMKSTQTLGKRCPLSNQICTESCMLYDGECQILKKWR